MEIDQNRKQGIFHTKEKMKTMISDKICLKITELLQNRNKPVNDTIYL